MKHIHETWAFLVKSGILRASVYNVYGSQNELLLLIINDLAISWSARVAKS